MRCFIAFLMLSNTFAQDLVAEVRNIPGECGVGGALQYWINTAAAARETTLQVIGGDFLLTDLDVLGDSTMKSTTVTNLQFDSLSENAATAASHSIFRSQTHFEGGLHLKCPVDKCTVEADSADVSNSPVLEFTNLDIIVKNMNIRNTIVTLQTEVQQLKQEVNQLKNARL